MTDLAGGTGRVSGRELLRPSPRLIEVARAYVDSLEQDSRKLLKVEEDLNKVVFQAATISNHNRTLQRVLEGIRDMIAADRPLNIDHLSQIMDVLKINQMMSESIFTCECGHSMFDHDDQGCQFIGCKPICGGDNASR